MYLRLTHEFDKYFLIYIHDDDSAGQWQPIVFIIFFYHDYKQITLINSINNK